MGEMCVQKEQRPPYRGDREGHRVDGAPGGSGSRHFINHQLLRKNGV